MRPGCELPAEIPAVFKTQAAHRYAYMIVGPQKTSPCHDFAAYARTK